MSDEPQQPESSTDYAFPYSRKDARLERRAMRSRWPVAEQYREPMVNRQIKIALDPNTPARDAVQAFRAVLAADELNMEQEKRDLGEPDSTTQVNVNVNVQHEHHVIARIDGYLAEYDALAARAQAPVRNGTAHPES